MSDQQRATGAPYAFGDAALNDPVDRTLAYLHRTFRGRWCVGDVATVLRLSESHVSRLFRRHTGWSIRQYVAHLRMGAAVDLLRTTSMTVKEVAASVGYSGTSAFDHEFSRTYGRSPREWRGALRRGKKPLAGAEADGIKR